LAALLHGTLVVGVSQTAAFNRGRHLYSAGRPSGWALAHISRLLYKSSDDIILILQQKRVCDGTEMCCEKKTLIGWRNVSNMRWRAPGREVDQRGLGQRLCKKIAKHVNWTGMMLWIVVDGRSWFKGWMIIRIGDWVNVSSGTGSPR